VQKWRFGKLTAPTRTSPPRLEGQPRAMEQSWVLLRRIDMDELLTGLLEPVAELFVEVVFDWFFTSTPSGDLGNAGIQKLMDSDRK